MGPGRVTRVLDSNVVIDALAGHPQANREILGELDCRISRISWIEVLVGCRTSEEEQAARQLMATLVIVDVASAIADEAVVIRRNSRLKLPDAIVLATARVAGCQLVTRNTKDFSADDPGIRVPYRL